MLYGTKDLWKCKLHARDGDLGSVFDLAFDDRDWSVRAVIAETGRWLPGRRVLIPRDKIVHPNWKLTQLEVDLTRMEIEASPGVVTDPPLSYAVDSNLYRGLVWNSHAWGGFVGARPSPEAPIADEPRVRTHVRSAREITNYRIEAKDGRIGHVEDFLLCGEEWRIHHVVVDTRNWWPGKKVVIPASDVIAMNWAERTADVAMTKDEIRQSQELAPVSEQMVGGRVLVSK